MAKEYVWEIKNFYGIWQKVTEEKAKDFVTMLKDSMAGLGRRNLEKLIFTEYVHKKLKQK